MPWDYALILVFLGLVVPWLGRRRIRQLMSLPDTSKTDRLALYASTVAFQWLATGVIFWRATARGLQPRDLGLAVPSAARVVSVAIALTIVITANQWISLRRLALKPRQIQGILPQLALKLFPRDNVEKLAFSALVATVALCEEFIYRGFAQRVLQDISAGALLAGIAGSAALFALAHAYQGRQGLLATFIVGLIFATARAWTGSLAPSLAAHFAADFTAGMVAGNRMRAISLSANKIGQPDEAVPPGKSGPG